MTRPPKVLALTYSSVLDDPRVIMEGRILTTLGYRVTVIGVALGAQPRHTSAYGMRIKIVPLVDSYHPLSIARGIWGLVRGRAPSTSGGARRSTYLSLLMFNLWILRLALLDRPDVIHCQEHQPLPGAWLLARMLRIRLVYDAHENTSLNRAGIGSKGAMTIRLEQFFLPRVDAVITVGDRLARSLEARGAKRVVVVGNWKRAADYAIDERSLEQLRADLGIMGAGLVISYFGALEPGRDIEPLLAAVGGMPTVHLLIGGRGELEPSVRAAAAGSPNIHWLGWQPLERIPVYTQLSDAIYCCLNAKLKQLEFGMPNKLFEAFVARKAIIARSGIGEMSDVLAKFPAGLELDEVTATSLRDAFQRLQDPALMQQLQAGAEAGGRVYNTEAAEQRLADLFSVMVGTP